LKADKIKLRSAATSIFDVQRWTFNVLFFSKPFPVSRRKNKLALMGQSHFAKINEQHENEKNRQSGYPNFTPQQLRELPVTWSASGRGNKAAVIHKISMAAGSNGTAACGRLGTQTHTDNLFEGKSVCVFLCGSACPMKSLLLLFHRGG
jgi:hypothetical protein